MGLHPEKAVSEILTSLKYEWKGSHHCNGRKPFTLQQTLSAIFCKDRNMMPSRFLITFGEELDREAIYCKFSTEWQNRIPTSLLFPLGVSKLGEPSAHLKSLKREEEGKKKKAGFVSAGLFLRSEETLASSFAFPEYLIRLRNKTRELITERCDDTVITVNYRAPERLFITVSLLI